VKTDWRRDTRICPTIDLQQDLLSAIRTLMEQKGLGPVEAQALVCFETLSERLGKPSMMERLSGAGHKSLTQAVIITPTRLVWAQRPGDDEAQASSELLARLDVSDYEKSPTAALMPDHGLEVMGIPATDGRVGTLFFGLGEGPDADHARRVFKDAVRAAHGEGPPVPAPETPAAPEPDAS